MFLINKNHLKSLVFKKAMIKKQFLITAFPVQVIGPLQKRCANQGMFRNRQTRNNAYPYGNQKNKPYKLNSEISYFKTKKTILHYLLSRLLNYKFSWRPAEGDSIQVWLARKEKGSHYKNSPKFYKTLVSFHPFFSRSPEWGKGQISFTPFGVKDGVAYSTHPPLRGERKNFLLNALPYGKSFLCYWILPFAGFVFSSSLVVSWNSKFNAYKFKTEQNNDSLLTITSLPYRPAHRPFAHPNPVGVSETTFCPLGKGYALRTGVFPAVGSFAQRAEERRAAKPLEESRGRYHPELAPFASFAQRTKERGAGNGQPRPDKEDPFGASLRECRQGGEQQKKGVLFSSSLAAQTTLDDINTINPYVSSRFDQQLINFNQVHEINPFASYATIRTQKSQIAGLPTGVAPDRSQAKGGSENLLTTFNKEIIYYLINKKFSNVLFENRITDYNNLYLSALEKYIVTSTQYIPQKGLATLTATTNEKSKNAPAVHFVKDYQEKTKNQRAVLIINNPYLKGSYSYKTQFKNIWLNLNIIDLKLVNLRKNNTVFPARSEGPLTPKVYGGYKNSQDKIRQRSEEITPLFSVTNKESTPTKILFANFLQKFSFLHVCEATPFVPNDSKRKSNPVLNFFKASFLLDEFTKNRMLCSNNNNISNNWLIIESYLKQNSFCLNSQKNLLGYKQPEQAKQSLPLRVLIKGTKERSHLSNPGKSAPTKKWCYLLNLFDNNNSENNYNNILKNTLDVNSNNIEFSEFNCAKSKFSKQQLYKLLLNNLNQSFLPFFDSTPLPRMESPPAVKDLAFATRTPNTACREGGLHLNSNYFKDFKNSETLLTLPNTIKNYHPVLITCPSEGAERNNVILRRKIKPFVNHETSRSFSVLSKSSEFNLRFTDPTLLNYYINTNKKQKEINFESFKKSLPLNTNQHLYYSTFIKAYKSKLAKLTNKTSIPFLTQPNPYPLPLKGLRPSLFDSLREQPVVPKRKEGGFRYAKGQPKQKQYLKNLLLTNQLKSSALNLNNSQEMKYLSNKPRNSKIEKVIRAYFSIKNKLQQKGAINYREVKNKRDKKFDFYKILKTELTLKFKTNIIGTSFPSLTLLSYPYGSLRYPFGESGFPGIPREKRMRARRTFLNDSVGNWLASLPPPAAKEGEIRAATRRGEAQPKNFNDSGAACQLKKRKRAATPRSLIQNRAFILNSEKSLKNKINLIKYTDLDKINSDTIQISLLNKINNFSTVYLQKDKFANNFLLTDNLDNNIFALIPTSVEQQRKTIQKKRRRKKLKKETRRRKKRKRFYPRPTWLRYTAFLKFVNKRKRISLNKFQKNSFSQDRIWGLGVLTPSGVALTKSSLFFHLPAPLGEAAKQRKKSEEVRMGAKALPLPFRYALSCSYPCRGLPPARLKSKFLLTHAPFRQLTAQNTINYYERLNTLIPISFTKENFAISHSLNTNNGPFLDESTGGNLTLSTPPPVVREAKEATSFVPGNSPGGVREKGNQENPNSRNITRNVKEASFNKVFLKSYWLRTNLNPYLKRVKNILTQIKEPLQKWQLINDLKALLNVIGGFTLKEQNLSLNTVNNSYLTNNSLKFQDSSNFSNVWENTLYYAEHNRVTYLRIEEFISQIRENFATLINYGSNFASSAAAPGVKSINTSNNKKLKVHSALRATHINHSKIQHNKREEIMTKRRTTDFWVKLGKTLMTDYNSGLKFMDYTTKHTYFNANVQNQDSPLPKATANQLINIVQNTIPLIVKQNTSLLGFSFGLSQSDGGKQKPSIARLRTIWALSKIAPYLTLDSAIDSLSTVDSVNKPKTNLNSTLYKRKQIWVASPESVKFREQTKYNKTKKMLRQLSIKIQTLLNEQSELIKRKFTLTPFSTILPPTELVKQTPVNQHVEENRAFASLALPTGPEATPFACERPEPTARLDGSDPYGVRAQEDKGGEGTYSQSFLNSTGITSARKTGKLTQVLPEEDTFIFKLFNKTRQKEEKYKFINNHSLNKSLFSKYQIREFKKSLQMPPLASTLRVGPEGKTKPQNGHLAAPRGRFAQAGGLTALRESTRTEGQNATTNFKINSMWLTNLTNKSSYWWLVSSLSRSEQTKTPFFQQSQIENRTPQNSQHEFLWFLEQPSFVQAYSIGKDINFLKAAQEAGSNTINKYRLFAFNESRQTNSLVLDLPALVPFASLTPKGASLLPLTGQASERAGNGQLRPVSFCEGGEGFASRTEATQRGSEANKQKLFFTIFISTLIFHFCTVVSLLSISQIRGVLKFYLLAISKIYKTLLTIFNTVYIFYKTGVSGFSTEAISKNQIKKTLISKGIANNRIRQASIGRMLPKDEPSLSLLAHLKREGQPNAGREAYSASVNRRGKRKGVRGNLGRRKQLVFLNSDIPPVFLLREPLFLVAQLNRETIIPSQPNVNQELRKTKVNLKQVLVLSISKFFNFIFVNKNFTRLAALLPFATNPSPSGFAALPSTEQKTKQLSKGALDSLNRQTLKNLILLNKIFNYIYILNLTGQKFLKQGFDVIGRSGPKSIFNFLEKPGELIIDWIAYLFLVEWSSSIANTIPETADMFLATSYYKLTCVTHPFISLLAYPLPLSGLPLAGLRYANGSAAVSLKTQSGNIMLPQNTILNANFAILSSTFIQNRIYHLYEILLFQFYQPDTDLIIRQKKGTIFWNIWGDFLTQIAEESNINISELTSLKEEQIKLLEKANERSLSNKRFGSFYQRQRAANNSSYLNPLRSRRNPNSLFAWLPTGNPKALATSTLKGSGAGGEQQTKAKERSEFPLKYLFTKNYKFKNDVPYSLGDDTSLYTKMTESFAAQQFLSYEGKDTELFIDLHPPKAFTSVSLLKKNESVQTSIGSLVCQIFAGIMSKQISKNILIIIPATLPGESQIEGACFSGGTGRPSAQQKQKSSNVNISIPVLDNLSNQGKTLLIQAIAGETELKIITDNAYRYAMVYKGVAVGIKLLRDVFDSLCLHTPCLFLLEDIHAIAERRPLLISDDEKGASPSGKSVFGGPAQREEIHEKNQILYQLSKHIITHYKKPYKGDFSLLIPTNHFSFDLFSPLNTTAGTIRSFSFPASKISIKTSDNNQNSSRIGVDSVGEDNAKEGESVPSFSLAPFGFATRKGNERQGQKSILSIKNRQLFAPPATSPFSLLTLKEDKKFKPYKNVSEMPWSGLPGEQLAQLSKSSYSIRVKVAILADMAISTLSVKLDMITDLLVIIDSVKGNRGFVVFATTNMPSILDPALRRPGRFDETITLSVFPNLIARWNILKASSGLATPSSAPPFLSFSLGTGFLTLKKQTNNLICFDLTNFAGLYNPQVFSSQKSHFLNSHFKRNINFIMFNNTLKQFSFGFPSFRQQTVQMLSGDKFQIVTTYKYNQHKLTCFKSNLFYLANEFTNYFNNSKHRNYKVFNKVQEHISSELDVYYFGNNIFNNVKQNYNHYKKQIKILSRTYLLASDVFYQININNIRQRSSLTPTKNVNFLDCFLGVREAKANPFAIRNMEISAFYILLYANPLQFKNYVNKLISSKIAELILLTKPTNPFYVQTKINTNKAKTAGQDHWRPAGGAGGDPIRGYKISPRFYKGGLSTSSGYERQEAGNRAKTTAGDLANYKYNINQFTSLDTSWKMLSSLVLSLIQKRYLYTSFNANNLIVAKFLSFNNNSALYEAPSPPSANILLPARRYENYRRSFSFFSNRKISISITEKIQYHQQQRLVKRLYGFPVQDHFRSEVTTRSSLLNKLTKKTEFQNKISVYPKGNQTTNFTNATLMIGNLTSELHKPSNSNWFIKNRILMRHKNYLINQWYNAQLPEHNAETTFLSDIDWRYCFIESIGDLLLDFPDAQQYYNPRNRRWFLTTGYYHNWFNFEKEFYMQVYTHFMFDSFTRAFKFYEQNREILDFYAFYISKSSLINQSLTKDIHCEIDHTNTLNTLKSFSKSYPGTNEIQIFTLYKRFNPTQVSSFK